MTELGVVGGEGKGGEARMQMRALSGWPAVDRLLLRSGTGAGGRAPGGGCPQHPGQPDVAL